MTEEDAVLQVDEYRRQLIATAAIVDPDLILKLRRTHRNILGGSDVLLTKGSTWQIIREYTDESRFPPPAPLSQPLIVGAGDKLARMLLVRCTWPQGGKPNLVCGPHGIGLDAVSTIVDEKGMLRLIVQKHQLDDTQLLMVPNPPVDALKVLDLTSYFSQLIEDTPPDLSILPEISSAGVNLAPNELPIGRKRSLLILENILQKMAFEDIEASCIPKPPILIEKPGSNWGRFKLDGIGPREIFDNKIGALDIKSRAVVSAMPLNSTQLEPESILLEDAWLYFLKSTPQ